MKKLIPVFLLGVVATASIADVKVTAFMRHTFRGISKSVGPHHVKLPEYGVDVSIPNLGYVEDATPHGLVIAREYAAAALEEATNFGLTAIGESPKCSHWNEIRPDLATERTFWTGLYLRDGLYETAPGNLSLNVTGCATEPASSIDVASARGPVMHCLRHHMPQLLAASPHLSAFQKQAQDFLRVVRMAISAGGGEASLPVPAYSENGTLPEAYSEVANLASYLVMSASLGAPLPSVFKDVSPAWLNAHGSTAVRTGVNTLGIRFFINNPGPVADAVSTFPLLYLDSLPANHKSVVVTHDDVISDLLRSLDLISSSDDPHVWGIYPMETVILVVGDTKASVVRMRIQVRDSDGSIPGEFGHELMWSGSREQWDAKVQAVYDRVAAWQISDEARNCLNGLEICDAQPLSVLY